MKKTDLSSLMMLLVLLAGTISPLTAQEKPESHLDSITIEELRDHLFYLASDDMKGRDTGSTDYLNAAQYAASQFREAGLKTVCKDADGKETYLQQAEFVNQKYSEKTQANMWIGQDETVLNNGKSILIFAEGESGGVLEPTESVFLGYGIEEPQAGWNDYGTIDPTGKVVFFIPDAPAKEGKPVLPQNVHAKYAALNGLVTKIDIAVKHNAAAVVIIFPGQWAELWGSVTQQLNRETMTLKNTAGAGLLPEPVPVVIMHPSAVAKAFEGSGYDPVSGMGDVKPSEMNALKLGLKIDKEISSSITSPNVVGLVEGSDPKLKDQYIVVGAHLDHIGVKGGEVYNGADDNGSGSAALLEAAEAAAMSNPRRSIIFVLYTAEEEGLLGSRYFVENPPVPIEKIVLDINADMIGRNSPAYPNSLLLLVSKNLAPGLLEFVKELNETKVKADLNFSLNELDTEHHLERSDQFSFHQKGIPNVLVTRGFSGPDYHQPSDDPDTINYPKVLQASRLMYELAMGIADRDPLPWKEK